MGVARPVETESRGHRSSYQKHWMSVGANSYRLSISYFEGASHGVLVGGDAGVVSGLGGGQVAITTIREIKALRRLGTHENVVSLIELYTPTGDCLAGLWW